MHFFTKDNRVDLLIKMERLILLMLSFSVLLFAPLTSLAEPQIMPTDLPAPVTDQSKPKKVSVTLKSREMLPLDVGDRFIVKSEDRVKYGFFSPQSGKKTLTLPGKKPLELPASTGGMISKDQSTIILGGDGGPIGPEGQSRFYLRWLTSEGKVVGELSNYFEGGGMWPDGGTRIAISEDGFTAIKGRISGDRTRTRISLFSPKGEKIWESVSGDQEIISPSGFAVTPHGEFVIALAEDKHIVDKRDRFPKQRILIFNNRGRVETTFSDLRLIQFFELLEDGRTIFFQAKECFGTIDIKSGKKMWLRKDEIRFKNGSSGILSPDGKTLFLISFESRNQELEWFLRAIDFLTGEDLMIEPLPKDFYSNGSHSFTQGLFESVTPNEVGILTYKERLIFSWKRTETTR